MAKIEKLSRQGDEIQKIFKDGSAKTQEVEKFFSNMASEHATKIGEIDALSSQVKEIEKKIQECSTRAQKVESSHLNMANQHETTMAEIESLRSRGAEILLTVQGSLVRAEEVEQSQAKQQEISKELETKTEKIDALLASSKELVSSLDCRLREFRQDIGKSTHDQDQKANEAVCSNREVLDSQDGVVSSTTPVEPNPEKPNSEHFF